MTTVTTTVDPNPLREGLDQERVPDPSVLVIFGASGDLTQRKLVPSLYSLAHDGLLPAGQTIIGFAKQELTDDSFRAAMRLACDKFARLRPVEEAVWQNFAERLHYVQGEFGDVEAYRRLNQKMKEIDEQRGTGGRRIYYLAVPPQFFPVISTNLGQEAMVTDPEREGDPYTRVIIEKPFGRDLESARELNRVAVMTFRERQVFRIDHYLGKETVQNLLLLRFANGIFEPFWNRQYIDHVQFTVAESIGVEKRGNYFEKAGITRDIIQNHMLQLVSLIAMEPPAAFEADAVRDEKVKVLRALRELPKDGEGAAVRGQYSAGSIMGEPVIGYRDEPDVDPKSRTNTYAALEAYVDNWRWADVPFYLRAGKRLPKRVTDIAIHFRPAPHLMFKKMKYVGTQPNVLAIRIQPDEGISLKFDSKVPGPTVRTHPVTMEFRYATSFGAEPPEAYERLLLETMLGDSTLFARRDEVETAWAWLDPLLKSWEASPLTPPFYPAGSWGPEEGDGLIEKDGRRWRRP